MSNILIYPNGEWLLETDLEDQVQANPIADDYSAVDIPEIALEEDIDLFSEFWIQSNQTTQCAKEYWEYYCNNLL